MVRSLNPVHYKLIMYSKQHYYIVHIATYTDCAETSMYLFVVLEIFEYYIVHFITFIEYIGYVLLLLVVVVRLVLAKCSSSIVLIMSALLYKQTQDVKV